MERFDALAHDYDLGRKAYPQSVINFCVSSLSTKDTLALDLGCGTGIASRQLAQKGLQVIGCDVSLRMPRRRFLRDSQKRFRQGLARGEFLVVLLKFFRYNGLKP